MGEVIQMAEFTVPREDRILAEAVEAQRQVAEQALIVASMEDQKLHDLDPST